MNRNLKNYTKYILFISLFLVFGCGSQGDISGGSTDTKVMRVEGSIPDAFYSIKNKKVKIVFDKPIDEASVLSNLSIYPPIGFSWSVNKNTLSIKLKGEFKEKSNYYITIGKNLACTHKIKFAHEKVMIYYNEYLSNNELSGNFIFEKPLDAKDTVQIDLISQDSVKIFTQYFSGGDGYQLKYLNKGSYLIRAFIDKNKNGQIDYEKESCFEDSIKIGKRFLVKDIALSYQDTIKPKISLVKATSQKRVEVAFSEEIFSYQGVRIFAKLDTTPSLSKEEDSTSILPKKEDSTSILPKKEDSTSILPKVSLKILAKTLVKNKLYLLVDSLKKREYFLIIEKFEDFKENLVLMDTFEFQGTDNTLRDSIGIVSMSPKHLSGVESLKPEINIVFDRMILEEDVKFFLKSKEDEKNIEVEKIKSNLFEYSYRPIHPLENYTNYLFYLQCQDIENNSLKNKEKEYEFITTAEDN